MAVRLHQSTVQQVAKINFELRKKPPSGGFFLSAIILLSKTVRSRIPLPPIWLAVWSALLSCAWIIPNHYYPWPTFHSDAWVAAMMGIAATAVLLKSNNVFKWHSIAAFALFITLLSFVQFYFGFLIFSGEAWIAGAYLAGFMFAVLIGSAWHSEAPENSADGIFIAVGIASIISVGLQLRQWLGIDLDSGDLQIWTAEFSPGRPSANLGQPNQLATLLVWGLLSVAWGANRKKIGTLVAVFFAAYLLFGISLTQSRTAYVSLLAIAFFAFLWKRWLTRHTLRLILFLFTYFIVCVASLQLISDALGLDQHFRSVSLGGESTNARIMAYRLFSDAVLQKPWFGYGINELATAQLSVAQNHPTLESFFIHSHNLFLDFIIWWGLPLGIIAAVIVLLWVFKVLFNIRNIGDAILAMFVISIGLHSLLELPLHHAYFLLPTGVVMGILDQRLLLRPLFSTGRFFVVLLWLVICGVLAVVVRDYLRVDESFRTFRLEAAHIGTLPPGNPPNVLLLDHMRESIVAARLGFPPDFKTQDLPRLKAIALVFPTPANLFNYGKALALAGKPNEARNWLIKVQRVQPAAFDPDMRRIWETQSKGIPLMAAVAWPDENLMAPSKLYDPRYEP